MTYSFPPPAGHAKGASDPALTASDTLETARTILQDAADRIQDDPQTNSVFSLTRSFFRQLEGGATSIEAMEALVDEVHAGLAHRRAEKFREQHADVRPDVVWGAVCDRLNAVADDGWEAFRAVVERETGGIVFTAHPTFALPRDVRHALAGHVEDFDDASLSQLTAAVGADARAWSASISLASEHDEVQDSIAHAQHAQRLFVGHVLAVARERFPDHWRDLHPATPTLASWVGYDLDGRTDIHWGQSVALRLSEKALQLGRYGEQVGVLAQACPDLKDLADRLGRAAALAAQEAEAFRGDLRDADALVHAAKLVTTPHVDRITHIDEVLRVLDEAAAGADDDAALQIGVVRAQMQALQLGAARIHLRVNAAQIRQVLSRDLGLETEDRDLGRVAFQELIQRAGDTSPVTPTFADVFLEQSTARRQMMMCALWLKYIDAGSPIRFLIAESENPATVLGALYLARQYGVEHMLDISPLFETPEALETGGRFMARLLDVPEFLAYVRTRGYLSVQLGFSDAGRFIGQIAADMAIERIHNLIATALADQDASLGLLIFNTHGESMGRGAFPGSFSDRFAHVLTNWTRCQAAARGLSLMHEVSFQGGDGFLHFATPALAETSFGAWCLHALSDAGPCEPDPFYTEREFTWDTYRSLRTWHERLFDNPDYGHLLGDFAGSFLVRAGSRQTRRSGGPSGPRALRAISHNATLQQLAAPVNTAAGIGSSIRRETDSLISLINRSPRMHHLVNLALQARILTSLPALRAYANVYDPSFWVAVAKHADADAGQAYRRMYYVLQEGQTHHAIRRVADKFSIDLGKFDRLIEEIGGALSLEQRHKGRLDLHVLHAVRQALMMHAMALTASMPSFSPRHDASLRDVVQLVIDMRLGEAVGLLRRIFPRSAEVSASLQALMSDASGPSDADEAHTRGYDKLHAEIIDPLEMIDAVLHKITLAVCQAYRAYG